MDVILHSPLYLNGVQMEHFHLTTYQVQFSLYGLYFPEAMAKTCRFRRTNRLPGSPLREHFTSEEVLHPLYCIVMYCTALYCIRLVTKDAITLYGDTVIPTDPDLYYATTNDRRTLKSGISRSVKGLTTSESLRILFPLFKLKRYHSVQGM
jgi:hypothetical protein